VVADIARQYPIPIICALLGAPRNHWQLFSDWTDDIFKLFSWNVAHDRPVPSCTGVRSMARDEPVGAVAAGVGPAVTRTPSRRCVSAATIVWVASMAMVLTVSQDRPSSRATAETDIRSSISRRRM